MNRIALAATLAFVVSASVVACGDDTNNPAGDPAGGEAGGPSSGGSGGNVGSGGTSAGTSGRGGSAPVGGEGGAPSGGGQPGEGGAPVGGEGGAPVGLGGDGGAVGDAGASGAGGEGGQGNACLIDSSYDLGEQEGSAGEDEYGAYYFLPLEPAEELLIELYDGIGVFEEGITPGVFELSGDELDFATCGLCIRFYEGVDGNDYRGVYMPTGGTVTFTSVAGWLTGSLSNVTLQRVNIDPETLETTPHPDGCTTEIESLSFDAALD